MTPPIDHLREIVARLRAKDGCPWDREQTHASLRPGLLEEAHEVVEAIDAVSASTDAAPAIRERADADFSEELGDLLLQVVMHSQIASETGRFTFDVVAAGIAEKLIRRHPHVFAAAEARDSAAVLTQWDEIKREERRKKGDAEKVASVLDGIPGGLPALMYAEKVAKKAAKVGFDWSEPAPVFDKIREELTEIEHAMRDGESPRRIEEEMGDLLFAVANLARKMGINGEVALRRATGKFSKRFRQVEQAVAAQGKKMEECTLEELDAVWDTIKKSDAPLADESNFS